MAEQTSLVAQQVRLMHWAEQIRECQNRPETIIANRVSIWRPGSLNVLKWQERIARQNVILLK